MAQFTAYGGRLKLLFKGEGVVEPQNPLQYKLNINGGWLRMVGTCPLDLPKSRGRSSVGRSRLRNFASFGNHSSQSADAEARHSGIGDGIDDFDDFEEDELSCFRGLVLDISYRPVNVVCWKRAICLEFMEKADVLEYYDQTVKSPNGSFYIPAVLRVPNLLQVVKKKRIRNTLSRKNIFCRDDYTCQYCSSRNNLTVDHVLPIARGGKWTWENLVTACAKCNSKKGQKTLEEANMNLIKILKAPKEYDIVAIPLTSAAIRMLKRRNGTPEEWRQYLSKSAYDP
ncbi:hypothetical protein Nepgr_010088 [Nepenthes gracilis]|uniref:HNH nuclease domain-containing protein n=1 Tax=Nepenthes gracilis TaxID=150966 RepID=A0AAD3XKQ7_NEPGR|nr:hypothetical protein Nepgr_010088 [Nepenthes gracilis]